MSYFSNSLKDLYDNLPRINTITSGCTDVVVTESETGILKSTPFNIRIPIPNQLVKIHINGKLTDLQAKTDEHGVCFFETEHDTSKKTNTSTNILNILLDKHSPVKNACKYNELPIAHKLFLENIGIDIVEIETARKKNFILRSRKAKPSFYSLLSTESISSVLYSPDHLYFLSNKSDTLHFYLKNYKNKKTEFKECSLFSETCANFKIEYSNCGNLKGEIQTNFNKHRFIPEVSLSRLIVRITTCKLCRMNIYLPFELFAELEHIIHLLSNAKNEKSKFQTVLEKRYYRSIYLLKYYEPKNFFTSNLLNTEDIKKLNLKKGLNEVKITSTDEKNQKFEIKFNIYKISYAEKIVISDIDGTVTKSDVWGNLYDFAGKDYTHTGIAKLYSLIESNGYTFIYLSSRPFSHYNRTKSYLNNIKQDSYSMPKGAIFLSVKGLFNVIYTEIIKKSPHVFKISTLCELKNIMKEDSLKAGFGNKFTDILSYKNVGIPENRIFTINSAGVILLNSGLSVKSGYNSLQGFVNAMFPADKEILDLREYNDYNYWN